MPEMTAAMMAYIYGMTAVFGLCMGSFLNCFAYRYIRHETVMKGRSKCALCGHTLAACDLIPVFSWLLLRRRCRYCGGKLSPSYPAAELICGAVYLSVLLRFGLTIDTIKYIILASLLFAAAFSDIHGGLIPDRLVIIGLACAFAFTTFSPRETILPSLLQTLINGLSVALPLLIIVLIFDKISKKETMGGGDIKLMFLIGLYFDWKLNILILITACVIGLIFALIRRLDSTMHGQPDAFSFGPALALAAWLVMLYGNTLLTLYLGFFGLAKG